MKKKNNKLDPNWVTGFVDGKSCFTLSIVKNVRYNTGWVVQPCFQIKLHYRDEDLLLQIKSFFENTGKILLKNNFVIYQVRSIKDILRVIIPHLDKYPCITQKQSDFFIWKKIIELMNKGEHLNKDTLINIISLKASLNKGLSEKLKIYFPKITKIKKPKKYLPENIDPNWIAGFFSGEGCFSVSIYKSNTHKKCYGILLQIIFTQHLNDELLFYSIKKTLNCGTIYKFSTKNIIILKVSKFKDVYNKMIPLFKQYHIKGIKFFNFQDFCKVAEIINNKQHYTLNDLNEIIKI
jgi:LAGLIDADG endonuclease